MYLFCFWVNVLGRKILFFAEQTSSSISWEKQELFKSLAVPALAKALGGLCTLNLSYGQEPGRRVSRAFAGSTEEAAPGPTPSCLMASVPWSALPHWLQPAKAVRPAMPPNGWCLGRAHLPATCRRTSFWFVFWSGWQEACCRAFTDCKNGGGKRQRKSSLVSYFCYLPLIYHFVYVHRRPSVCRGEMS